MFADCANRKPAKGAMNTYLLKLLVVELIYNLLATKFTKSALTSKVHGHLKKRILQCLLVLKSFEYQTVVNM